MSPDTTPPSGASSDALIRYVIEEQRLLRSYLTETKREQSATFDRIWQHLNQLHLDVTRENGEHNGDYRVLCKEIAHQSMRISVVTSSIISVIVGTVVAALSRFFFT